MTDYLNGLRSSGWPSYRGSVMTGMPPLVAGQIPFEERPPIIPCDFGTGESVSMVLAKVNSDKNQVEQAAVAIVGAVFDGWTNLKADQSRSLVAAPLWWHYATQIEMWKLMNRRNIIDGLKIKGLSLVDGLSDASAITIRVRVDIEATNYDVNSNNQTIIRGDTHGLKWQQDWIIQHPVNDPAPIVCRNCSAQLGPYGDGVCNYCGAACAELRQPWVVAAFGPPDFGGVVDASTYRSQTVVFQRDSQDPDGSPQTQTTMTERPAQIMAKIAGQDNMFCEASVVQASRLAVIVLSQMWTTGNKSTLQSMTVPGIDAPSLPSNCTPDNLLVEAAAIVEADSNDVEDVVTVRVGFSLTDSVNSGAYMVDINLVRHADLRNRVLVCANCGAPTQYFCGRCAYCKAPSSESPEGWLVQQFSEITEGSVQVVPTPQETASVGGEIASDGPWQSSVGS